MESAAPKKSTFYDWVIICLLLILILAKGFYTFLVVGDPGQPTWDYRPVEDVPGQSVHAIYKLLPDSQHVRGAGGN